MKRLALLCLTFFFQSVIAKNLCDNVRLMEGSLSLTANEKILVCGSSKSKEAWRDIPLAQAEYQLKTILQNKGFMNPKFEQVENELRVWPGETLKVKRFELRGAEGVLSANKKRRVLGEPITPDLLDSVSAWADYELRTKGYPCPKVDVKAQAWDRRLILTAETGKRLRIRSFILTGLGDLDETVVRRYKAFHEGDWYDVRDTELTALRMMSDGLFETALIGASCNEDSVDLPLQTSVGKPRLLKFGFGASTEEFPFVDIGFRNGRLDERASSLLVTLHASPRMQNLNVSAELYKLPWSTRTYLGPRWRFARDNEEFFETWSSKAGADLARRWDLWHIRWLGSVGPTLNYVKTLRGEGPKELYYVSWDGTIEAMSHEYEIGVRQQFEGWQGIFNYRGQREGIGAPLTVDRYQLSLKHLWNIGAYSPPHLVLATRVDGIVVNADPIRLGSTNETLPVDYRIYYGGDGNIRGFSRQSLNNNSIGYLTALSGGMELRLVDQLPYHIEPFLLYDVARLGIERFKVDEPVFVSSGAGIRWASPFGTLRFSAARGEIIGKDFATKDYPEEWVYFFSFGREF